MKNELGEFPADGGLAGAELNYYSDEALLRHVLMAEGDDNDLDFSSFAGNTSLASGGRGFMQQATSALTAEELLSLGARRPWGLVFDTFSAFSVASREETLELCQTSTVARLLKGPNSARCLALVAHRRRGGSPQGVTDPLWHKLKAMPLGEREAAMVAFGRDGAVSCAYEGIDIAPVLLSG